MQLDRYSTQDMTVHVFLTAAKNFHQVMRKIMSIQK